MKNSNLEQLFLINEKFIDGITKIRLTRNLLTWGYRKSNKKSLQVILEHIWFYIHSYHQLIFLLRMRRVGYFDSLWGGKVSFIQLLTECKLATIVVLTLCNIQYIIHYQYNIHYPSTIWIIFSEFLIFCRLISRAIRRVK